MSLARGVGPRGAGHSESLCYALGAVKLALVVALGTLSADRRCPAVGMAGFREDWVGRWESVHAVFLPGIAKTDAMKDDRNYMQPSTAARAEGLFGGTARRRRRRRLGRLRSRVDLCTVGGKVHSGHKHSHLVEGDGALRTQESVVTHFL